ncbi:MAG TPA: galactose oxidase-like domain-containing protein [Gemmatimonadales bacterium]|nr:galactose oxidase-like domain-containing protein [Gemmatimonadales bacterium]
MSLRRCALRLVPFTIAAASVTCSGDGGTIEPPHPATLTMVGGDAQAGTINEALADSLVVRVNDAQGQPLGGVSITWTVGGGGSVDHATVESASDGRAAVQRVLGSTAGAVTTTATVPDVPAVVFTATAEAGAEPQLIISSQPSATAKNNVPLVQQPILRLEDATGEPMAAGIPVTASVDGATLGGTAVVASDEFGEVHFTDLALSGSDGTYNLLFAAPGVVSVRSAAIALSGASNGGQLVVTTQPSSAAENSVALVQQPVVHVEDGAGAAVGAGVAVTASTTGATLAGTLTVQTDASGDAHYTDLALSGPNGTYTLTFSAPNASPAQSSGITLATTSAEGGQWTAPFSWPIVAIHTMLLPDGRVLSIGRTGSPMLWDPATGLFSAVPSPARLFCAGHALLSDGRVLVAGGHISDGHGLPNITIFSPTTNAWSSGTPMVRGRWYPTSTVMGNGDVTIIAGTDEDSVQVTIPEVWSNGSLRQLSGADQALPWYPRAFLAPDGSLFVAGPAVQNRFLNVAGAGSWRNGPRLQYGKQRSYGSAVMYDDGKILYAGGGLTTNTAEVIDLNQASPSWQFTGSMSFARRHLNLTALPTGEVLATGGVGGTVFNDVSKGVHAAEMWDPQTGQWTTLASNAITRGYHGTSLLLPDGRVLNSGSGEGAGAPDQRNAEIYSPPYLSRGPRPVITSAPTEVAYGAQFRIETPQAAAITHVSFIRLGAVTHAFDENQRFQRLSFTADASGLTVTAPAAPNRTPPGHYMVFILDGNDVPSVAKIVRIF